MSYWLGINVGTTFTAAASADLAAELGPEPDAAGAKARAWKIITGRGGRL